MDRLDITVLRSLRGWLASGRDGWLCTVLSISGSAPRPAGSLPARNAGDGQVGSLSGGCVEDDLLEWIRSGAMGVFPHICDYGVSARQNQRVALPCGGRRYVLAEKLIPAAGWSGPLAGSAPHRASPGCSGADSRSRIDDRVLMAALRREKRRQRLRQLVSARTGSGACTRRWAWPPAAGGRPKSPLRFWRDSLNFRRAPGVAALPIAESPIHVN